MSITIADSKLGLKGLAHWLADREPSVTLKIESGLLGSDLALSPASEHIMPLAWTPYNAALGTRARIIARVRLKSVLDVRAPIFIIGCGRSGTSLLGKLFATHPVVSYFDEPYDRWAAMDPETDFLQLYSRGEHHCLLDASSVTATARRRYKRLMSASAGLTMVEKSSINALRIGYLDALAPEARFVHIVRDGVDVAHSIERIAAVTRRLTFRPALNKWWGVDNVKWTTLSRDGRAGGYYPDEVRLLRTDAQRGAYEWLLSLREVGAWRACLGSRFCELRYQDLIDNPRETLRAVMDSVHMPCPDGWVEQAAALVEPASRRHGPAITLPGQMCADFNSFQEDFQFSGRAIAKASAATEQAATTNGKRPMNSAPRRLQPAASIRVTSVTSLPEARAFAAEWAEFAETAGARSPFTHPDWLMPWAERFLSPSEQIWLLAARRHGQLVGVAPFYRRSWGPGLAHSMELWGTGRHSDLIEVPEILLGQESPRTVARALVTRLCTEVSGWDWATVPLANPLWLEPEWLPRGGEVMVLAKTVRPCVVLPIDQSRPPVKRNLRESLRRARNRLDRSYPGAWSVSCATARPDLISALPDLARLHQDRSHLPGRKRHPNFVAQQADWSFLSAAVTASAERGGASIYRLLAHGDALAALLVLHTRDGTYFSLSGMSPEAWEFSPTTLLQGRAIDDAVALGHRWVNLSTGPDTAKLRWSETLELSAEFVLVPDRLYSRVAFAAFWQASAAAEIVRERNRHRTLPTTHPKLAQPAQTAPGMDLG
jgi:CelD/BcsL family acetyltransferase involved in cellulose biosynthesis